MSIDVRPLDPADESQIRAFWEVGRDAVAERRYQTYLPWRAAQAYLATPTPDAVETYLIAWDGGAAVGTGLARASTVDNPEIAFLHVSVLPDRRREGIASTLLAQLESWARSQDCTTVTGEAYGPVDGTSGALELAAAHGYRVDIEDGVKVADLQATSGSWADLAAEAAPFHRDYRLVTSWPPLTDELAEAYCEVDNRFYELAPSGELEREAETLDVGRLRVREERAALAGRVDLMTVAFDADGRAAALTELMLNTTMAHRAMQGGTVVLPEHRGHRLGLALKVANHQALLARFPDIEWILTANADVNEAMNAINDRLGFRIVERCVEVVKSL